MRLLALALLALFGSLCTTPAQAVDTEQTTPVHRWYYENLVALRLNPLGFQDAFGVYSRWRLHEDTDSVLFNDTYLMAGPVVTLTPAYSRTGLAFQTLPIAVLRLGARADYVAYFGSFDQMLTFESANQPWSDTDLDAASARGENAATTGWLVTLDARAQAKVGPIAARYTFSAYGTWFTAPNDVGIEDVGYYDQSLDTMAPLRGWTFVHDTDLLYAPGGPLILGARWSHVDPRLGGTTNNIHRVGPLVAYRLKDERGAAFNQPTLLLISQWHTVHRNRTGQDVSQAMPYLVLAFAMNGDFKPWN